MIQRYQRISIMNSNFEFNIQIDQIFLFLNIGIMSSRVAKSFGSSHQRMKTFVGMKNGFSLIVLEMCSLVTWLRIARGLRSLRVEPSSFLLDGSMVSTLPRIPLFLVETFYIVMGSKNNFKLHISKK